MASSLRPCLQSAPIHFEVKSQSTSIRGANSKYSALTLGILVTERYPLSVRHSFRVAHNGRAYLQAF